MQQEIIPVRYCNGLDEGRREALIQYTNTHAGPCIRTVTTPDGLTSLSLDLEEQRRVKAVLGKGVQS